MGYARKIDLPKATGSTMAICGLAALAVVTVLGFSLASGAGDAPGGEPVTLIIRPPAAEVATIGAIPFDVASCTTTVAARR